MCIRDRLQGGMPLPVIQQLLGHEDPKTTMIYAAILPEAARRAYRLSLIHILAYPPAVYGKAGTTISLLYKGDANYAVLSNIGSADVRLCGWRMFKLRYPSSSSPAVWMQFEWENPPMKIGVE